MHEPMQNPYPPNVQAELARERNHIAADRSLLSFVRNSVTLISAGVGIDEILNLLVPVAPFVNEWGYILSLLLVGLGVINLYFAIRDYQGETKRLRQPEYYFTPRWSLGGMTGLALFIVGAIAFFRLGMDYWG
jgi:putative membrane protein